MDQALQKLKPLGVNWISIHPYASINRQGIVRYRPAQTQGYLVRAVQKAKKAGVKLFWKPHLAYWGSFSWRGAIDFGQDQQAWQRFFDSYRAFILDQAQFAEQNQVPLFAIGVELDRSLRHSNYWLKLIKEVRRIYRGKITYAANWDSYQQTRFWSALDYVGIQAYFPLNAQQKDVGWGPHLKRLAQFSKECSKPILFTEIGYARSLVADTKPWQPQTNSSAQALALRTKLSEYALSQLHNYPFIAGVFWWKWIPGRPFGHRDFAMQDPELQPLLKTHWAKQKLRD